MRKRTVLLAPAALATLVACAACGGSNSETPWPVPPDDVDLGPEGEARREEELRRPRRAPAPPPPSAVAPSTTAPPLTDPPAGAPQPSGPPPASQF